MKRMRRRQKSFLYCFLCVQVLLVLLHQVRCLELEDTGKWSAAYSENSGWNAITYGKRQFLAVAWGGDRRIMTSPNGFNWTVHVSEDIGWAAVTYAAAQWWHRSSVCMRPLRATSFPELGHHKLDKLNTIFQRSLTASPVSQSVSHACETVDSQLHRSWVTCWQ